MGERRRGSVFKHLEFIFASGLREEPTVRAQMGGGGGWRGQQRKKYKMEGAKTMTHT